MKLSSRMMLVAALVGVGMIGHVAFIQYLEAAGELKTLPLDAPLETLPYEIDEWEGVDLDLDDTWAYADDHLYRRYKNKLTDQEVTVWLIYSTVGEDRSHHPDVCMQVAGKQEDTGSRREFAVEGHPAPVQQYRFVDGTLTPDGRLAGQWVFYWHYTLQAPEVGTTSKLQRQYQRMHKRPSSMTAEVFAPERIPADAEGARAFVKKLDRELQRIVGRHAKRGSQRLPVRVINDPRA